MRQAFLRWHRRVPFVETNVKRINAQKIVTDNRSAFLRKKALQDMQVNTSKFMPRAISPQIRQIKGDRDIVFIGVSRSSAIDIV